MQKTEVKTHYQSLSKAKALEFKLKVMHQCSWSQRTFYRKLDNPGSIHQLEMAQINLIVQGAEQLTIMDQLEQEEQNDNR